MRSEGTLQTPFIFGDPRETPQNAAFRAVSPG